MENTKQEYQKEKYLKNQINSLKSLERGFLSPNNDDLINEFAPNSDFGALERILEKFGEYMIELEKLEFNKDNIKLKKGSGLIFSGQNTHKGEYLKDGTRYILTGFINYGEENECQDYIEEVLLGTKKN